MRPGVPYDGEQLEQYDECMRLVPAIIKARTEQRPDDVLRLYRGMLEDAKARGVGAAMAWSIFSSATIAWTTQLYQGLADTTQVPIGDLLDRAIVSAANWVTSAD